MLYRLSIVFLLCVLGNDLQAQGTTSAASKEATIAGDLKALAWDMGTFYASTDSAKANRIIRGDMAKFSAHIATLHTAGLTGMRKSALFITEKLWAAYQQSIKAPRSDGNLKRVSAQTTQLMSACEYLRETLEYTPVKGTGKRNAK